MNNLGLNKVNYSLSGINKGFGSSKKAKKAKARHKQKLLKESEESYKKQLDKLENADRMRLAVKETNPVLAAMLIHGKK